MRTKQSVTVALRIAVNQAVKMIPSYFKWLENDKGKKERVFAYASYTMACEERFDDTWKNNTGDFPYLVRDLALEKYDPKYKAHRAKSTYKLAGYDVYEI